MEVCCSTFGVKWRRVLILTQIFEILISNISKKVVFGFDYFVVFGILVDFGFLVIVGVLLLLNDRYLHWD